MHRHAHRLGAVLLKHHPAGCARNRLAVPLGGGFDLIADDIA